MNDKRVSTLCAKLLQNLVLCALAFPALPAHADEPTGDDWLLGTWSVSYIDAVFAEDFKVNEISGTAFVHRDPSGDGTRYYAIVQFQDPADESIIFRMHSARVTVEGSTVTIELPGTCPTRARTSDGKTDVRDWFPPPGNEDPSLIDHTFAPVQPTQTLRFRPAEGEPGPTVEVPGPRRGFPARERYTLTLERGEEGNAGLMSGTWQYTLGPNGMYGRRVGKVDEETRVVSGPETWHRSQANAIRSVTESTDVRTMLSGHEDQDPRVHTRLVIRGWDLPTTSAQLGNNVIFSDELIKFVQFVSATPADVLNGNAPREPGELIIEVTMGAGVMAGSKSIQVGQASAAWELSIQSREPRLRFVVDNDAQRSTPARLLTHGQTFYIEAMFDQGLDFSHRLVQVDLTNGQPPIPIVMTRLAGDTMIYRSHRLRVIKPGNALDADNNDDATLLPIAAGRGLIVDSADTHSPQHWGSIEVFTEDALTRPSLVIFPANVERWHSDRSINRITKDQPFALRLRLPNVPPDGRDETHKELTVRFELVSGGSGFNVTCKRLETADNATFVYYAPSAPITVTRGQADWHTGGVLPWALPGIDDGDRVSVSYGEGDDAVTHILTVHDTELNRRIAMLTRQVEMVKEAGQILSRDSRLNAEDLAFVEMRLKLVAHAQALNMREDMWGIHKLVILETYLQMLQEPREWHAQAPQVTRDPRYGLELVSAREHELLYNAIDIRARERILEIQTQFVQDIGVGAAEMVMSEFTAFEILTAITGLDARGRPVSLFSRVFGGINAAAKIMLTRLHMRGRGPFGQRMNRSASPPPRALTPAQATRQLEFEMRRAGLPSHRVAREAQAMLRSTDRLSPEAAAIGRAIDGGATPADMAARFGRSRPEVAQMLDDYFRKAVGIDSPNVRQRMLRRIMGEDALPNASSPSAGDISTTDLDLPRPATTPDGPPANAEASWPSMNDVDASGSRTRASGHAPLSSSPSLSNSAFEDLEWDIFIGQGRARQPHRGSARMTAYHDARINLHEALLRERGMSPDNIAASTANLRTRYAEHMQVVDLIEKTRTWREFRDIQAAEVFLNKGFTPQQSAIGHFYLNEMAIDGASDAIIRQTRATHLDIPKALGIDRATWRSELGTFLQGNYGDINDGQLATILDDYFRFVDGGT